MIDLHIHTIYSDGSDSVIEILKKAEEKKLQVISITDHDTCGAYNELKTIDIKSFFSGDIIKGVELKTIVNGYQIELLGYNVDTDYINKEVQKHYLVQREKRIMEKNDLKDICENLGIILDASVIEKYNPKDDYAGAYIFREIIKHFENKKFFPEEIFPQNFKEFYRLHMSNPDSPFFIDMRGVIPTPDQVIRLIKESGGLVFIPHPFAYGDNSEKILSYLLDKYEVDGIECFYNNHTKDETELLINICKNKGLLISGGSDYHGASRPQTEIGTGQNNLSIPFAIINNWYQKSKLFNN